MTTDDSNPSGSKHTDPKRLQLCEHALDQLEQGAEPNELAIAIIEQGELPVEVVGPVVGTLWNVLTGTETKTRPTPAAEARFALAQLAAGVETEAIVEMLHQSFGSDSDAAAWTVDGVETALRGGFGEEFEFSILDLSPKIRIGAGVGGLLFFTALTIGSLNAVEPGGTVLVAGGALAASLMLIVHGLMGLSRGE